MTHTKQMYSTRPPLFTIQRWPEAAAAATIIHAAQQTVRPWWQMAINNDNLTRGAFMKSKVICGK